MKILASLAELDELKEMGLLTDGATQFTVHCEALLASI